MVDPTPVSSSRERTDEPTGRPERRGASTAGWLPERGRETRSGERRANREWDGARCDTRTKRGPGEVMPTQSTPASGQRGR